MFRIQDLKAPVIGLSPMDGITDAPFRYITKKYGNPDVTFTEFTHVMGMCMAGDNVLHHFIYDESERPVFGQIFGKEPDYFYHAAKIICELGFTGVDINMGCPAKTVANSGSGAGLIRTPDLAREIIAAVREGVKHWVENGELTGLKERSYNAVKNQSQINRERKSLLEEGGSENREVFRELIPVSVKTRIGYDVPVTKQWIGNIDKANPDWITVHGRTLKQLYGGAADWNEIKIAVESTSKPVLANGDIKSRDDVEKILELTGAYGVLVGRATYGNPWIFNELRGEGKVMKTKEDRIATLLEHAEKFIQIFPDPRAFVMMRKHFGWYCTNFDNAVGLRSKLMQTKTIEEVRQILSEAIKVL
ncbi:MAG: tRNA-dihydrouridine synthase family protein [Candidatus Dojkabacteria bacterium]